MIRILLLISMLATHYGTIAQVVGFGFTFARIATGAGALVIGVLLVRRLMLGRREREAASPMGARLA